MNSDRGKLLRTESTGPARNDQPALDASSVDALMELIVKPSNLDRAWRQVRRNRGAGTDRRLVVARRDNDQGVRTLGSSELGTGKATALGWDVSA